MTWFAAMRTQDRAWSAGAGTACLSCHLAALQARFMALNFHADPWAEMDYLTDLGLDGFFTDCPQTAAAWRDAKLAEAASARPAASRPAGPDPSSTAEKHEAPESAQARTPGRAGGAGWVGTTFAAVLVTLSVAAAAGAGWAFGRRQAASQGYRSLQQRYSMGAASAGAVERGLAAPVLPGMLTGRFGWGGNAQAGRTQEMVPQHEGWMDRPGRVTLQPMPSDVASLVPSP